MQVALNVAQRDTDHRVVEEGQEQDNTQDGKGKGAAAAQGSRRLALRYAGRADHLTR